MTSADWLTAVAYRSRIGATTVGQKLIDLLRRSADEAGRVERFFQIDFRKHRIAGQAVQKIVAAAAIFDLGRGRLAVTADSFVKLLPIAAGRDGRHQDVFRRHERQFLGQDAGR